MPSTTSYDFGDVVLVPFPFSDQSTSKRRPAVVVSSPTLHRQTADLVVMAVTTQTRPWSSLEVEIAHWRAAGLLRPSLIKPALATIERTLVVKRLGRLHLDDQTALKNALTAILG